MSKINTPITGEEKSIEVSRSEKVLQSIQDYTREIAKNGKAIYSIVVNGTIIQTTDVNKWNRYFRSKQVIIQ